MYPGPINAGLIEFTLIPKGAKSFDADTVIANTAALLLLYAIIAGVPLNPATLDVFTIENRFFESDLYNSDICFATDCNTMNIPLKKQSCNIEIELSKSAQKL